MVANDDLGQALPQRRGLAAQSLAVVGQSLVPDLRTEQTRLAVHMVPGGEFAGQ